MVRKYIITVATIFIIIIFVLFFINYKEMNKDNVSTVNTTEYSDEEIAYNIEYGNVVSSIMIAKNMEYELVDAYTLFYDEDIAEIFGYQDDELFGTYVKFNVFKTNNDNIVRVLISFIDNNDEEFIYGEAFFDLDKVFFYVDDNLFSKEPTYGYYKDNRFFCYDVAEQKVVPYKNAILNEACIIYRSFIVTDSKDFDKISQLLVNSKYEEDVNGFVPDGYKVDNEFTTYGYINDDEYQDEIVVLEKKYNYVNTNNFYAYPRIALMLFGDEDGYLRLGGFLSNLVSEKSALYDDSFQGFSINKNVISVRNNFDDNDFYIEKYWLDENGELRLIGYTKGESEYDLVEKGDKYFISTDYNLLDGNFIVDFELINEENEKISNKLFHTNIGEEYIYYNDMKYATNLDIVENAKKYYYSSLAYEIDR